MDILELFAGSRSFSKAAESLGHRTYSTDIERFTDIDCVCDIRDFNFSLVPFKPDIIWASPPCTYFSVASIGKHWNQDHTPKSKEALVGVELVKKTLEIIDHFKPKYWYIENPRGKLRKLDVVKNLPRRVTVTYCQYGDTRMKPTDIWTNDMEWQPRPMCKNGDSCHVSAPRGSKTGTQGLKNAYYRSVVPEQLCLEILKGK